MPKYSLVVSENEKSMRVDKFIADNIEGMNRSKLKAGAVSIKVNGKDEKVSYKTKAGDSVEVVWEDSVPANIEAQDIPLDIIYEDDDVTVVNKAQGMVTHPAAGNWSGTLVNALLFHWKRRL